MRVQLIDFSKLLNAFIDDEILRVGNFCLDVSAGV